MTRKFWNLNKNKLENSKDLAEMFGFDPFIVMLLENRGITNPEDIGQFLNLADDISSSEAPDLFDPFLLHDMDKAVFYIKKAIEENKKITVYGDYDCDGITSTVLLYTLFRKMGAAVDYYIPSRLTEGYGMNISAVEKIASSGTNLIVTVDNGITAFEQAKRIKELGMELVVTDHHQIDENLPDALANVDAHRPDDICEEKNLSGVGIAYKLALALTGGLDEKTDNFFLQLVCIGTIADAVPLVGENRILVTRGLEQIRKKPINGVFELLNVAKVLDKDVDSQTIAFYLAPRINAAGRLGSCGIAVDLLLSETDADAYEYAGKLNLANSERQQLEKKITEQAIEKIEKDPKLKYSKILVVDGDDWHEGVIGIAAARLAEMYTKPTVVISNGTDGICKGSARSFGEFSLFEAFSECRDGLVAFGGHALAAGLTIRRENIPVFREKINEYASKFGALAPVLDIDCRLNPKAISLDLIDSLEPLKPYGNSNLEPIFGLYNMKITKLTPMGQAKNHMRIELTRKDTRVNTVLFKVGPDEFEFQVGDEVNCACAIIKNEYAGRVQPQIQIKAIKSSAAKDREYFDSMELYRKLKYGDTLFDDEIKSLCPDRKTMTSVFKLIKEKPQCTKSAESIQLKLGLESDRVGMIAVCVDAFEELGLIKKSDFIYEIVKTTEKKDLSSAPILKKLGYIDK